MIPATAIQRRLWDLGADGPPPLVRAVRLRGDLDLDRFEAAIAEVSRAFVPLHGRLELRGGTLRWRPDPHPPAIERIDTGGSTAAAVAHLRALRVMRMEPGSDRVVRFHLLRIAHADWVVGISAHEAALDLRSLYAVFGALLQAYFGRFHASAFPSPTAENGLDARTVSARREWWAEQLKTLRGAPSPAAGGHARETASRQIDEPRWAALTARAQAVAASPTLAVVALVAWWRAALAGDPSPLLFGTSVDLRPVMGLGPAVGSLSDEIIFAVEPPPVEAATFRTLLLRTQAGLLDAIVHYLPLQDVLRLARADSPRELRDYFVHYCPSPPASASTRGDRSLTDRGMSIELFADLDLVPAADSRARAAVDLHVAESESGIALVVDYEPGSRPGAAADAMLEAIDALTAHAAARPDARLIAALVRSQSVDSAADAGLLSSPSPSGGAL